MVSLCVCFQNVFVFEEKKEMIESNWGENLIRMECTNGTLEALAFVSVAAPVYVFE